jgi:hypothetical protein
MEMNKMEILRNFEKRSEDEYACNKIYVLNKWPLSNANQ